MSPDRIVPMISSFTGAYRFLSNFQPCGITLADGMYASVERAFQASKTDDPTARKQIREASCSAEAKRLGRRVTLRSDWEHVKVDVMLGLLRQKFGAEPFRSLLLATGQTVLVEGNTWGDQYWGVNAQTGVGHNILGNLLMKVREELR